MVTVDLETKLKLYETMVRIRRFEEKVIDLFARGKIPGFLHSYYGEEAVATGACAQLRPDDYITSTHRGHGHILAKGARTDLAMAELFGKRTGYCHGKGGSMHIADPDIGILGAKGIVGSGIVIANGAGFSAQYRGTDQVTVCFFGDGASNQGTFHEGLNIASLFRLPVIFVCENNGFGMSTSQCNHQAIPDIAVRAQGYNMPGVVVDGNNVLAVYETVGEAIKRARAGGGPTLVEAKTFRVRGHYEGDTQPYRTREELEACRERCPSKRLKGALVQEGVLEAAEAIEARISVELDAAVAFAESSPPPEPAEALQGIFAPTPEVPPCPR